MSRIGKRPIPVADEVQVQYTDREFSVKGPKGEMKMRIHDDVELNTDCLLYTSPSPRDKRQSRMPSSA